MEIRFDKYSVHGNDFIVIDNRNHALDRNNAELFRSLCRRRTSIGADGVILIDTDKPDFIVHFLNSDGLPALMCGNGGRAAVDYANRLGIITDQAEFWVGEEIHKGIIENNSSIGVEVHLKTEKLTKHRLNFNGNVYEGLYCDTGVPHVVFIDSGSFGGASIDFARTVRNAPEFSKDGVNVDIVHINGKHSVSIKTYERGIEDFTLSCGTGAVAAVFAGMSKAGLQLPVIVRSAGGKLRVSGSDNSGTMWIWGSVEKVYSGIINR